MQYALHESTPAGSWPFSKLCDKNTWDFDEIFADRMAEKAVRARADPNLTLICLLTQFLPFPTFPPKEKVEIELESD